MKSATFDNDRDQDKGKSDNQYKNKNNFLKPLHLLSKSASWILSKIKPWSVSQLFSALDPTKIDKGPANATIIEGGDTVLFCKASGNPSPAINWTKQDSDEVLHEGDTYTIANLTRQEAGSYVCSAGNGVGKKQQRIAVVTVHCEFLVYCSSILTVELSLLSSPLD